MRPFLLFCIFASISLPGSAQDVPTPGAGGSSEAKQLSKAQQLQVRHLLESAEAGSADLDAASRIVSHLELARAYQDFDKLKAFSLLESSLMACRDLQLDSADKALNDSVKRQLQSRVVRDFAALAPEKLDQMIDQLTPEMRAAALEPMISYYGKSNRLDRASEVVMYVAQEGEMPYGSASSLMSLLGRNRQDEVRSLFISSLTSYQNHEHKSTFGTNEFPDMVTKFQDQLPPSLLQQAVDEVLAQAKKVDERFNGMSVSIASGEGAASFESYYDFRLFQLMPVLRHIDKEQAEKLLKERQDVNTLATKYPDGMNSLNSQSNIGGMSISVGVGSKSAGNERGSLSPSELERQRMSQIVNDASKNPQDAIANASTLSPPMALEAYVAIARAAQKESPSAAIAALDKAMPLVEKFPLDQQIMTAQEITTIYVQLNEVDKAKSSLEQSLTIANKLYKKDINADDPNRAPKSYWPSTYGYRAILTNAQKIDPTRATALVKEIPDDGVRVFSQIAMAVAISGKSAGGYQVMSAFKNTGMSMRFDNGN